MLMIHAIILARPEKNHRLQLAAFAAFLEKHPEHRATLSLVLLGGCRNDDDKARVDALTQQSRDLGIKVEQVTMPMNA